MADVGPTPECPCGANLSEEEKNAVNWGRDNPVFQNPMTDRISNAQGEYAKTKSRIDSAIGVLGAFPGAEVDQLQKLSNTVGNMQGALSSFGNVSNQLSGLPFTGGGPDLLSLVSTVGAAVNLQCALGIDGLDVGAGIGVVMENGKLKLNVAIKINADISKMMDKILGPADSALTKVASEIQSAVNGIAGEIGKIASALNAVAGEINGAIAAVGQLYNDALDFLAQFTAINFAINFSNDPCSKFGIAFQQQILNPAFIEQAKAANPLNRAVNPGFGSTFR